MNNILNWIKLNGLKIGAVIMGVILLYTAFLFFHARSLNQQNASQLEEAHNQIAALSHTIQENQDTWSRLSQEREDQMSQLQQENHQLSDLIQSRNEQIVSLTDVIANFHPVHIVADGSHATQTQTDERLRVDFDQTHSDYMRVHGFTLTNPAEAQVDVEFTRPIHLTVASTQAEDGEWNTYVTSDISDLEIGQIDASINPHVAAQSITQEHHDWYDGFQVGVFGGVGTSGHTGQLGLSVGWDFGPADVNLMGSGIVTSSGGDVMIGLGASINPFDL